MQPARLIDRPQLSRCPAGSTPPMARPHARSGRFSPLVTLFALALWPVPIRAQQPADPVQLAFDGSALPNAAPRYDYRYQFMRSQGTLPSGMRLAKDGLLAGVPSAPGQFRFSITVTDSTSPPQTTTRTFVLKVLPPLLMQWKRDARATGNRIDASVTVSNSTQDDFDLTFVVLAVAENGRATAIGYQHFTLKSGVDALEIPFGDTLPRGTYDVHVDAVAEVPEKGRIYRVRLQPGQKLTVALGP